MVRHVERRHAGFKFKSAEGGRDQLRRMHHHDNENGRGTSPARMLVALAGLLRLCI